MSQPQRQHRIRPPGGADEHPTPPPQMTASEIADLLQRLAGANHALAAELDSIGRSRRYLSQNTVDRLELLVQQMRPAALIRRHLSELEPHELLAGAREWHRRRPGTFGGDRR